MIQFLTFSVVPLDSLFIILYSRVMEDSSQNLLQEKIVKLAKENLLPLALGLLGLLFLSIGLIQIIGSKTASVKFEKGNVLGSVDSGSSGSSALKIKVDIEGQVLRPGVYSLNNDARVQDALIAAGGLSSSANRNAINLAAKIVDGQKIYVPAVGETANASNLGGLVQSNSNGLISINLGSQSELESLPAIGPVTAQKIINGRPYGALEELVSKNAMGQKTFEKIKDFISL